MRCLNCGTIVCDADPRCLSCGARCTTPVKDQPTGLPVPFVGITFLLVGIFGYTFLTGTVPQKDVQDHKTNAYACGLAGFFVGLVIDAILWSRSRRRWPAAEPAPAGRPVPLAPGAIAPRPPHHLAGQAERPAGGRSGLVRVAFSVVWAVGLFLVAGVVASILATQGVGDDPALRKKAAEHSGQTVGPWLLLGSIAVAAVGGGLGLLPGTGRKKA